MALEKAAGAGVDVGPEKYWFGLHRFATDSRGLRGLVPWGVEVLVPLTPVDSVKPR